MADTPSWVHAVWPLALRTERLRLRPVETADLPMLTELWRSRAVRLFLGGPVAEEHIAERLQTAEGAVGAFTVELAAEGPVLGRVTVDSDHRAADRIEVSYEFLPRYHGMGYAAEAVSEAIRWAQSVAPAGQRVVAVTQVANLRSRRLLERIGMSQTERFTEYGAEQALYTASGRPDPGSSGS
ncbi:GNAT family N-acetyltransferase [Kitasatospora sp. MAP5-34]|uniref:GNAT family N-acetyltransferase n=1 Tax=Kitasatospora sp. MAP5-34 TaxID=3035102 RepID=UPI002475BDAC|nr:GNAT family N-acetyltransferase [Kitasatospora sp. MAP5-34]MDH6575121.1 RimJ/RimL family protein N-acetyltransferase [Kitasatospora sp. MAP5-34]